MNALRDAFIGVAILAIVFIAGYTARALTYKPALVLHTNEIISVQSNIILPPPPPFAADCSDVLAWGKSVYDDYYNYMSTPPVYVSQDAHKVYFTVRENKYSLNYRSTQYAIIPYIGVYAGTAGISGIIGAAGISDTWYGAVSVHYPMIGMSVCAGYVFKF